MVCISRTYRQRYWSASVVRFYLAANGQINQSIERKLFLNIYPERT